MKTGEPLDILTPAMPAMNVLVCASPIRIVESSVEVPAVPRMMLLLPVVTFDPAHCPIAMLLFPLVARSSEAQPRAVLIEPVLPDNALFPMAVLSCPEGFW